MRAGDEILWDIDEHATLFIEPDAPHAGAGRITLAVAGLDALLERLAAANIEHEPIETYSNGVRHVKIPDPDGKRDRVRSAARRPERVTSTGTLTSALDAVVQVGDAVFPLRTRVRSSSICSAIEVVEEPAPLAEQHRDDVELELVEYAGSEREPRDCGSVYQHVLLACGRLASLIAVRTSVTW